MKINQVAAQLYTLRDFLKTPAEIHIALKKVREIGYESVQLSGLGPIENKELLQMLEGEGLNCCATHEDSDTILNDPQKVVAQLQSLNCKHTAYAWPAGVDMHDLQQVKALAQKLDAAGALLRTAGQVLSYHNHQLEFTRHGSFTALEIIYDIASRENLQGEIDTYWVQYGGGDPVDWCARLKGRLPLLHLKDYAIDKSNNPVMSEIGSGNLNWKAIISAAETSGCEWFIVEQDVCPADPFDSLRISFNYIKAFLCS